MLYIYLHLSLSLTSSPSIHLKLVCLALVCMFSLCLLSPDLFARLLPLLNSPSVPPTLPKYIALQDDLRRRIKKTINMLHIAK